MKVKNIPRYIRQLSNINQHELRNVMKYPFFYFYKAITNSRYLERKINDYRMLLDLTDAGISRQLMQFGTREKEHIIFLGQELKKGMSVLDIGANIGYYSLLMGKMVGEQGKVYALEPSSSNFYLLNINIKLNAMENVVEAFNIGISYKTGFQFFYQSEKSNLHTFYPKIHSGSTTESLIYKDPIMVPVMTVKDFLDGRRTIDLIRMDIEGFEVEVLESLMPLLAMKEFAPKIIFEVHQPRYDDKDHSMRKCLSSLFNAGFSVNKMCSHLHNNGGREAFGKYGYSQAKIIRTDGMKRAIYEGVSNAHAIEMMCDTDFVRAVLLERNSN